MICRLYVLMFLKSEMIRFLDLRKRVAVVEESDKSVLVRKAAVDFHTGLFPTQVAALKAHKLDASDKQRMFYHVKQLSQDSLPTPFEPVAIAVKVINHIILLSSAPTYTAAIQSQGF